MRTRHLKSYLMNLIDYDQENNLSDYDSQE
jgi:hypothetical protein